MKTFYFEMVFVATVLAIVFVLSGKTDVEAIGALGVLCTFGHASVANRMAEQIAHYEKTTGIVVVSCYKWEKYYFYMKEILWFSYFLKLGAYSALVGVIVFLLYPFWRRLWRHYYPYQRG